MSAGGWRIATNWFTAWIRNVAGELVSVSWARETAGSRRLATTRAAARRDASGAMHDSARTERRIDLNIVFVVVRIMCFGSGLITLREIDNQ